MGVQEIALITSMFLLVASVNLFLESNGKMRYMCFIVGASAGVAFYISVLFFNFPRHDLSVILRVFQNICFGTPLITTSFEKFSETERYKNLKTRMTTWDLLQKFQQL